MEKLKLLEELVKLKRLAREQEEKKTSAINNLRLNKSKVPNKLPREQNKSTIFFNPKKLNAIHNESTSKVKEKLSNSTPKLAAKVFINPNFKKPDPSIQRLEGHKSHIKHAIKTESSFPHLGMDDFKKQSSHPSTSQQQQQMITKHNFKISKLEVAEKKSINSKNHWIFVNPEFSLSSKINTQLSGSSSQTMRTTITADAQHLCKKSSNPLRMEQKETVVICHKRKIVMKEKMTESLPSEAKLRKKTDNFVGNVKKIFVNPKFEKKESNLNNSEPTHKDRTTTEVRVTCPVHLSSRNEIETPANRGTSMIPVLLGGREVSNKFTSMTHPLCAVVRPDLGKKVAKKTTQRVRTRSSSLVTVSTTKLVCKRRLSNKITETGGTAFSQPLFVSKTKLVRNAPKNTIGNNFITKIKVKDVSQLTPAQFASAGKLRRFRRKSSTDSTLNVSLKSKSAVVKKIKSRNGKSLKLIRKPAETVLPSAVATKVKAQNLMNSRKMELKQQASRIAMCLVQSRLKQNQFSKINVPVKVLQSTSYNTNVYKKNNLVNRKPLTKAALVWKKDVGSVSAKTHIKKTSIDMTKFIKSKYRLIRKQSLNAMNRFKQGRKIMYKSKPDKLVQRKKLKWKQKNNSSKRRLTRKDLSIKKIGGVFYRYSRTTLSKNNPSSKRVSQLQSKSVYQVTSGRRQNRYCLNKNPRRKSSSTSGGLFTTSPSGMSWRRINDCSARSILTQAKQKSLNLLLKKLKKNNEPCLFFHRYGQCSGHERGTCTRLHDRKYVAICKKFVQGLCTDDKCRLNHKPSCHNMPTCLHFLAGQCGRDNCPYPHIKVSDCAPVCLDFLKGFCQLGDQCAKRHFEICPSFEKGTCARGKYCPYPHPENKGENLKGKFKHIKRKLQLTKEAESVSTPSLRYFEDVTLQKENQISLNEDENNSEDPEVEGEEVTCLQKRPKLGDLPSFIPLSHSFQEEDS